MRRNSIIAAAVVLLFVQACTDIMSSEEGTVIAEVGNEVLTLEEVRAAIPAHVLEADSLKAFEDYRKKWVKRKVLSQEARRQGVHQAERIQQELKKAEEEILAQAMIRQVIAEASDEPVRRSEAQSYYEQNKDQFVLNERHVRFRHVRTETLQESRNAKAALQRGRAWEDVAEQYDVNPQEAIRNSRRFFPASLAALDYDQMHNYLQRIGVTEISFIHRIGEYFHFVQLMEDRSAGEHPEVDWVLDQIEEWLRLDRKQRRVSSFERNLILRAESNNEIRLHDVHNLNPEPFQTSASDSE